MGYNSLMPIEVNNQSILLCSTDDIHHSTKAGLSWASSPIMCLSTATENSYDFIILYIKGSSLSRTASMIELCVALKKNHHTSLVPLVAVCFSVNRQIIERIKEAGVDFVVFKNGWEKIDLDNNPESLMEYMKEENRPAKVLNSLCPYIHYTPINDDKELTTCRAYANYLVLGSRRLQELCQTSIHPNCPYHQSPRLPQ